MGMRPADFERCYADEFEAICSAWSEARDSDARYSWERTRTLAAITIQPHITKKIAPAQLIRLPWDGRGAGPEHEHEHEQLTPEERRARALDFARRMGVKVAGEK